MRVSHILESNYQNDPFEEHTPSESDRKDAEKRNKAASAHMHGTALRNMHQWVTTAGALSKISQTRKLRPGEEVVLYKGSRFIITTKDPVQVAHIKKASEKLSAQVDVVAEHGNTTSIRQISILAKSKRDRWDTADAVVLGLFKANATSKQMEGAEYVKLYLEYAVKAPWPELEQYIWRWPSMATEYVDKAYKGKRCGPYEALLKRQLSQSAGIKPNQNYGDSLETAVSWTSQYVQRHMKTAWPEVEKDLLKSGSSTSLDRYLKVRGTAWPEYEHWLLNRITPTAYVDDSVFLYERRYKKGKWPELKAAILYAVNPRYIMAYAQDYMGGRWTEAEELMKRALKSPPNNTFGDGFVGYSNMFKITWDQHTMRDMLNLPARCLLWYAQEVLQKRWPEAEAAAERQYKPEPYGPPYQYKEYAKKLMPGGKWPKVGL